MFFKYFRWALLIHRFKYGKAEHAHIPYVFFLIIKRRFLDEATKQGYAKHTREEVYAIGKADMDALDTFIGNKKFLFGDSPCETDPSIFAFISQIIHYDCGPFNKHLNENCQNLLRYFNTIKQEYWPDWDQRSKI
jgi:glutathione S-transferase